MNEASYFYKNRSIYFNSNISDEDLVEFAIHECIHFIQERRDKKDKLVKMGLSDYNSSKVTGLGLNEAAVQLMAANVIGIEKDYVKYFGIEFETISPSYYPVECCLVAQIGYLIGEDILFESTINSNEKFKEKFIDEMNLKTYIVIQDALDEILENEEKIVKYNNELLEIEERNEKSESINNKIQGLKNEILVSFMKAQNILISSYFNNKIKKIKTLEDLETFRKKLINLNGYIGTTEDYTFYNDFCKEKMKQLEKINSKLEKENNIVSMQLVEKKENIISIIIKKIKKLFTKEKVAD